MKIVEVFKSLQGEGKYAGYPMAFIRFSGCTRNCSWCDTKYHKDGKDVELKSVLNEIYKSELICFTGGEPLLHIKPIKEILNNLKRGHQFHIETNGDLLRSEHREIFDYISCSPKDKMTAKQVYDNNLADDIKIVTDLETEGVDMIEYATMLMPLTTYDNKKDLEIRQKVWNYCTENDLRYSPRLHYEVWGNKRSI